ncbi:MAG: hypothetical protein AAGI51_05910 [Pseudomonadota bacterium]
MNDLIITDAELGAYIDGELDAQDEARVERALVADADLRARLAAATEARAALRTLVLSGPGAEDDADDPSPETEALAAKLSARLRADRNRRVRSRVALAAGALMATAVGGWFAHIYAVSLEPSVAAAEGQAPSFVADAVGAHAVFAPDRVHPVEFFSQDEALMRDWFAEHLGDGVQIPHLEEFGFDLVGGRLLGSARGASAQLLYENARGERVSLVFGPQNLPEAPDAPRLIDVDGRLASWWRQGGLSWAVVEDQPGADVPSITKHVAELVRNRP